MSKNAFFSIINISPLVFIQRNSQVLESPIHGINLWDIPNEVHFFFNFIKNIGVTLIKLYTF